MIKRNQTQKVVMRETQVKNDPISLPNDGIKIKITLADRVKAEQERVRREAVEQSFKGQESMEEERKSIY